MNENFNKISFCVFGVGFKALNCRNYRGFQNKQRLDNCSTSLTYDVIRTDNDVTKLIDWSERIEVLGQKIVIQKRSKRKSDCDVSRDYSIVTSRSWEIPISGGWSFDDENESTSSFTDDADYLLQRIPSIVTSSMESQVVVLPLMTSSNNRNTLPMTPSNNHVNLSNNDVTLPPITPNNNMTRQKLKSPMTSHIMTSSLLNGEATKEEIKKFEQIRSPTSSMTDDVTSDTSRGSLFDSAGLDGALRGKIMGVLQTEKSPYAKVPNGKSPNGKVPNGKVPVKEMKGGNQFFRIEVNRLERMRDDLLRRNQYLKKEISDEKGSSKNEQQNLRIKELREKNTRIKVEIVGTRENFDSSKSRLTTAEQNYEQSIQRLCDVTIQKKEEESALKLENQRFEKKFSEIEKLKIEKKVFLDKLKTCDCDVMEANKAFNSEETKRVATENKQKVAMERLNNLKQTLIDVENRFRDFNHRNQILKQNYDVITSRFNELKKDNSRIEDKVTKLTNEFPPKLKALGDLNSVSQKLSVDLKKGQDLFRAKQEVKRNMVSLSSQTAGRLVAVRDIAWIKVAHEEIILSPNCGNSRRGGANDRTCRTVGSVVPVFEVFSLAPFDDTTSSICNRARNKKLCDDIEGAEFVWTGEDEN